MNNFDIKPSDRLNYLGEYYFSRKLAEVATMRAAGEDVISLAIGGPDRAPSSETVATLCAEASRPGNHSYQNTRGIPELREAFARWYKRSYGVELDPAKEILPLIGSKEGVTHICLTFLNPGHKVLVPNPGYPAYTSAVRIAGGIPLTYPLDENNDWQPDFDMLEKTASENSDIRLLFMNYPNMPTGAAAHMETFRKAVEFGKRHSIVIVHDNPYSFILNPQPRSIFEVEGAKDICIELNSLSKSHNMAGWRVAMLASNPEFTGWVLRIKSNVDSGQFRPVMLAAAKALESDADWYTSLNRVYSARRKVAEEIAHALNCTFSTGQQGLFLWAKIPARTESGEWLADSLLAEAKVFIAPGCIFGDAGNRYIRISLCSPEPEMRRALERITRFAVNHKNEL